MPDSVNIVKGIITNYLFVLKQNGEVNLNIYSFTDLPIFIFKFSYIIARTLFVY